MFPLKKTQKDHMITFNHLCFISYFVYDLTKEHIR